MKRHLSFGIIILFTILFFPKEVIAEPYPTSLQNALDEMVASLQEAKVLQEQAILLRKEKERILSTKVPSSVLCSCVQTAKYLGVNIPSGHNAWDLKPNTDVPRVGQLALMAYIKTGHVAVIAEILEDGYLIVEGNYRTCQWTERIIPKDYPALIGFWDEDNYWLAK